MKINDADHNTLMESIRTALVQESNDSPQVSSDVVPQQLPPEEITSVQQLLTEHVDSFYENFDSLINSVEPDQASKIVNILNEAVQLVINELNAAAQLRLARQKGVAVKRVGGKNTKGLVAGIVAGKAGLSSAALAQAERMKKIPPATAQKIANAALGK